MFFFLLVLLSGQLLKMIGDEKTKSGNSLSFIREIVYIYIAQLNATIDTVTTIVTTESFES